MFEVLTVWRRPRDVWSIVLIASGIASVDVLASTLFGTSSLRYVLAVPLGIMLGPPAVWGIAIGGVLESLIWGTVDEWSVVGYFAEMLFVTGIYTLWKHQPTPSRERSVHSLVSFLGAVMLLASTTALSSITFFAWGMMIVGGYSFPALVPGLVFQHLLPAVLGSPVVLLLLFALRPEKSPIFAGRVRFRPLVGVAAVTTAWLTVGILLSLLTRDTTSIPRAEAALARKIPDAVSPVTLFFLDHGPVIQLGLGTAALVTLTFLFWRPTPDHHLHTGTKHE